jgi:hypothetical protein
VLIGQGCKQASKLTGKQEKPDLLESELRTREREILEARSEIPAIAGLLDNEAQNGRVHVRSHDCIDPLVLSPPPREHGVRPTLT